MDKHKRQQISVTDIEMYAVRVTTRTIYVFRKLQIINTNNKEI